MGNMSLTDGLKRLGLSELEAKGYLAMIERKTISTSEIAKISNINRTTAYDIVNGLMQKGLCSLIPGKIKMYQATEIDRVAEQMIENNKKECLKANEQIQNTVSEIREIIQSTYENNKNNTSPLDYIEVLKNPNQIHRKFIELFARAETEVLMFCKPPFAHSTKKEMEEQWKAQNDATKKGVVVRGIFELPPEDEREAFFTERNFKQTHTPNDELKFINELPIKLNIFDNKACMFTVVDPIVNKTSLTMLVTEHEAIARSFSMLFESVWEKASYHCIVNGRKYSPLVKEENRTDD